jgi:hypothetical protein
MSSHTIDDPKAEAKTYSLTLVVLLILTAITVGASYIQFGSMNVVIALTIATLKGSLVAGSCSWGSSCCSRFWTSAPA